MTLEAIPGKLAQNYLKEYSQELAPYFSAFFTREIQKASQISQTLPQIIENIQILTKPGKKIRGALVNLGYLAVGGKNKQAIFEASLFIELFQTGILIHDDIMDRDDLRRGLITLHRQYADLARKKGLTADAEHFGESMAITVADIALFLSFQILAGAKFNTPDLLKALNLFSIHATRVGYGQCLDLSLTASLNRRSRDIIKMMSLKTSDYTTNLPLLVGATLGGCQDRKVLKAIQVYADCLGQIFQIQDDLLGMFGNQNLTGKPVGTDLREGKHTLLMQHLKAHGNPAQLRLQSQLLGKSDLTESELISMQQTLKAIGSDRYLQRLALKHLKTAQKETYLITDNQKVQRILKSLLHFSLKRNR